MNKKTKQIKNKIPSNAEIDLDHFDISGYRHPIEGLRLLQEVGNGKLGLDLYRCECGNIFIFPSSEISKVGDRIKEGSLLCNTCAPKGAKMRFELTPTDKKNEDKIIEALSQVFEDARKENRFSFSYYLWSVLPKSRKVDVMFDTISTFQSVLGRISSEALAKKMGVALPSAFGEFHEKTETVLTLMIYCHLHETTDFLDILYVLLTIATSEYRTVIEDERGFPAIKFPPEGLIANDVYKKLPIIIKLCKKGGYTDLAKLLKDVYKPYIRNAVYHSQYEITDESISFRYKIDYEDTEYVEKTLSLAEFSSLYRSMIVLHIGLLEGISEERDKLFKLGVVKEKGMTLTPIVKGTGFSVRIQYN